MSWFNLFAATALTLSFAPALQAQTVSAPAEARPGHTPGDGVSLPLSNKASNIDSANTHSDIAPTLPASDLGPDRGPMAYLREARVDLMTPGHTGQAQQALEMAETRALDRVIPPSGSIGPSQSPLVAKIRDAREALGTGDMANTVRLIDVALAQ